MTIPTASDFASHPDPVISPWPVPPLPCMSITSGMRVFPSYFGGKCRIYDRAAPPLWIITVVLPGFRVPAVQTPCAASKGAVPLSVAGAAPAAEPPPPVADPASIAPASPPTLMPPTPAPPLPVLPPEPPLPIGGALLPPDDPPEPTDVAASPPLPARLPEQPAYKSTATEIPSRLKALI